MNTTILPGITHTLSLQLNDDLLVTEFAPHFSGFTNLPPVFVTAFMVGAMEWACIEALKSWLPDGETTVGTQVTLSHVAPNPMGMPLKTKITAQVELVEVKGPILRFRVDCYDGCDLVGSGFHERRVIDTARFMVKVRGKAARLLAA